MQEEFLWVEKYRPRTIAETILPEKLKQTFQTFVDQKNIPNLLLTGTAGVGKTTVARALLEQLGCDYIIINSSLEGNIDTLRTKIADFASSVSFAGGRKYVILDEADYLTNATQPALRNFMEEFSSNCGFILTCNFKNKIIAPLHSRCSVVDFKLNKEDRVTIAGLFMRRIQNILKQENVKYDTAVVAEVVKQHFPDWRRVLNELQRYAASGSIDTGILANSSDSSVELLVGFIKDKNYTAIRKWIGENPDVSADDIFSRFYEVATAKVIKEDIPNLIIILAEYQYKNAFVSNPDINLAACMAEIMGNVTFK
jgi:DNA polymerase III delta prime subunit